MAGKRTDLPEFPAKPRFLAIQTGVVGDVLAVTPALRALRSAFPDAEITALVRPGPGMALVGAPAIKRLLPLTDEHRRGVFSAMGLASWVRGRRFDAAFAFHPSFRSALIPFLGAVPVRVGLTGEGARRGFLLTHKAPYDRSMDDVEKHLALAGLVGIEPRGNELEIFLTDGERAAAASLLEGISGRPLVAIVPGADDRAGRWCPERFAELGERLRDEGTAAVVHVVGAAETELAGRIRLWHEREGTVPVAVVEPDTVRVLAAVVEAADLTVATGGSSRLIASAVGTGGVFLDAAPSDERACHRTTGQARTHAVRTGQGGNTEPTGGAGVQPQLDVLSVESVLAAVAEGLRRSQGGRE